MDSEKARLVVSALFWAAAGAAFAVADDSERMWVAGVVLIVIAFVVAWPLARSRVTQVAFADPIATPDMRRLALLEAQLEHLPVAAWVQVGENCFKPLSSRARKLLAPGGVRDHEIFNRMLRTTERSGPVVLDTERGQERWQLQRQPLALDGTHQALLVLAPLEQELESESMRAWQQLLQVLTHEIMNSLTPIKSLSETAATMLDDPDSVADLRVALDAIGRRAESLSQFVRTYRKLTQGPAPTLVPVDVQAMFARVHQAVAPGWVSRGGAVNCEVSSPTLRLVADEGQLEQVLLALIHNAERATADEPDPKLWLTARQSKSGRLHITVRDNGTGVPAGLEQQIFLPFFTTHEGGQGIGLTIVRQLVYGMGGRVRYVRPMEKGAAFVLVF